MNKYNFTKWLKWKDKTSINDIKAPGVYILALNPDLNIINLLDKNIVYIGETNSTLEKRLALFYKAAKEGNAKHSGGKSFKENQYKLDDLFISIYPVKEDNKIFDGIKKSNIKNAKKAYIKFVERDLIKDIVFKNNGNNLLNKN